MRIEFNPLSATIRVLNRVDLEFFYYCVCNEQNDQMLKSVNWDNQIKPYLDENGVEVAFVTDSEQIPPCDCKNRIKLSFYTGEDKTSSFFRHLRNSFVHFRISHHQKYYMLNDEHNGKITMSGKIEVRILKDIVLKILKIKDITTDTISAFMETQN